jgi:hypothetical protein
VNSEVKSAITSLTHSRSLDSSPGGAIGCTDRFFREFLQYLQANARIVLGQIERGLFFFSLNGR